MRDELSNEESPAPRRTMRSFVPRATIGIAIAALTLWGLLSIGDPDALRALIARADLSWVSASAVIWAIMMISRAIRFHLLEPRVPFRKMLVITFVHNFALRIMPLRSGELVYPYLVKRAGAPSMANGIVGVAIVRIIDLIALVFALAISLTLYSGDKLDADPVTSWLIAGFAGALGLGLLTNIDKLLRIAGALTSHILRITGLEKHRMGVKVSSKLDELFSTQRSLGWRALGLQVILAVWVWALQFLMIHTMMISFGTPTPVTSTVIGSVVASLSALLPVAGIGTFGPVEAGWALAFSALGLSIDDAVASGLGFSALTFFYSLIVTLACLPWLRAQK